MPPASERSRVDLRPSDAIADEDVEELATYGASLGTLASVDRLERFTRLRSLRAHACELTSMDCEAFASLERLEELDLSSNSIAHARGLAALRSLRSVNLASNALTSLDGFAEASTTLERVNVSNNKISTLRGLARNDGAEWGIRILDARGNALTSLQSVRALSELTRLESLRLKTDRGSVVGKETNEICEASTYRLTMASLVPWLHHLDDVVVSVETSTKAMAQTLGGTESPSDGQRGSMTPPHAEQFTRTPRRNHGPNGERASPESSSKSRGVQVNLVETRRAIDFSGHVQRVRDEANQTEKPPTRDAETQKSSNDSNDNDRLRAEIETLREELVSAKKMTESLATREVEALRCIAELESTLREVRSESAENLANLKAMYVEEQNMMLNDRVDEARRESAAYVEVVEENSQLKRRIEALENESHAHTQAALQSQEILKSTEERLREMSESLSTAETERAEAESLNEELARVVESQRDELESHAKTRDIIVLLERELDQARKGMKEREAVHEAIKKAKSAAFKAEKVALAREGRAREREELAERLVCDVEALQSKLETAEESTKIKTDMLQHQSELIKSLKNEAMKMRQQREEDSKDHQARITDYENKLQIANSQCQALVRQVEALEIDAHDLERALAESDVDHASYQKAIANAKTAIAERDQMIEAMQLQLTQATRTLETRDSIERARVVELEQQLEELKQQVAIAQQKARSFEDRLLVIRDESDVIVREAYERVDDVEQEMRNILLEMASEKRANRIRMEQISRLVNDEDVSIGVD